MALQEIEVGGFYARIELHRGTPTQRKQRSDVE
jgi:hypothetical protein